MKRGLRALRITDRYGSVTGLGVWLIGVVIVVGFVGGVSYIGITGERVQCERRTEAMGRDGRYDWLAGCFVRLSDGTEVPLENYRLTDEERAR